MFWEKSIAVRILWQKFAGGGYPHPSTPLSLRGLASKWHTFNIEHYLHKSYLHKTTEKNYLEKFIEELGFAELSTQAKHLRARILHDNWRNDSLQYYR